MQNIAAESLTFIISWTERPTNGPTVHRGYPSAVNLKRGRASHISLSLSLSLLSVASLAWLFLLLFGLLPFGFLALALA